MIKIVCWMVTERLLGLHERFKVCCKLANQFNGVLHGREPRGTTHLACEKYQTCYVLTALTGTEEWKILFDIHSSIVPMIYRT